MMAECYEVRTNYYIASSGFAQNVMHFQPTPDPASGPAVWDICHALLIIFQTTAEALIQTVLSNQSVIRSYSARRRNSGGGPTATLASGVFGTDTNQVVSGMIAANNYLIPTAGPPWKEGHIYWPGVPQDFLSEDVFTTAAVTAYNAITSAIDSFGPDANSNSWKLVIYHKKTDTASLVDAKGVRPKPTPIGKRIVPYV
jgi:hypothetical protein